MPSTREDRALPEGSHAGKAAGEAASCAALAAISRYAVSRPQATALIDPDGVTLSYAELWEKVESLSNRLQEAEISPGRRVAVLLPSGALQVLSVVGVLNRHICLPLQSKTTVAEFESSMRRLSPSALVIAPEYEEEIDAAIRMGLTVLIARAKESPKVWAIRDSAFPRGLLAPASEAILFLVTSATTDRSKIVPLTTVNIDAGADQTRDAVQLLGSDRLLLLVSLCHRLGLQSALAQFQAGGAVIATGEFEPAAYLRWLKNLRPTWQVCAPTIWSAALAQLRLERSHPPASLRALQSAGAPLPDGVRDELEELLHVPVLNGYGATEAHFIAVEIMPLKQHIAHAAGRSCGSEIGIMASSGELLAPGEEGEIVVRGPAVFSGYEDDAEANGKAFQDGWFRTGDLGHLDAEGNLFVTGRLKEMINRGGEKIVPAEVDAVFASHPAVIEAAAFAVPHPTLGEDVACAIVLGAESQVTSRDLRSFAAQHLAAYKVPHRIHFVDQIPRGELGKPQRWVLAERWRYRQRSAPSPAEVDQHLYADGIYFESLHEIWARILDRSDLGFDEDFFEAGGDSLGAINMLAEVDQRLGCNTSSQAASFLDDPTLERLMKLVGEPAPAAPDRADPNPIQIFPVRKEGAAIELFCLPTEGREGLYFRRLATHLSGRMDLSIVRPANTFHRRELFALEREGREVAEVIRNAQRQGPYYVAGLCYGGVVAIEAARQLRREGQDVRVILFDVPTPGFPRLFLDWPIWLMGARNLWRRLWTSRHPGLTRNVRRLFRRLVWSTLVPFRRPFLPFENARAVQNIFEWARFGLFPVYKAHPVDAPILHILCLDEPSLLESQSRFGWRLLAQRGIEEQYVPLNHFNVLHESNLPQISEIILKWCGVEVGKEAPVL